MRTILLKCLIFRCFKVKCYFFILIILFLSISCKDKKTQTNPKKVNIINLTSNGTTSKANTSTESITVPTNKKYNTLFISIDDLRPELGCYGKTHMVTPNIDQIAQKGTVFNRAYCQKAICSPSRTSLMTGLRPDSTHIHDLKTHFRKKIPDVVTLPQYFKNNGYWTAGIGKIYHSEKLGDSLSWSIPTWRPARGKSRFSYQKPENQETSPAYIHHGNRPKSIGPALEVTDSPDKRFKDHKIASKAIKMLTAFKDSTFFLAVGFFKPHLPFVVPQKYWDMYNHDSIQLPKQYDWPKGVPAIAQNTFGEMRKYIDIDTVGYVPDSQALNLIHGYYACVSFIDHQVGRIMDRVKELGLEKNTIVVLWGDHGWKLGDYRSWCKHTNFEIDTRSPLIISHPDQQKAGKKTNALVEFVDIYPTLCELAGLPIPERLQGKSFAQTLQNPNAKTKNAAFSQYRRTPHLGYSMRTDRYRFTKWVNRHSPQVVYAYELYDHAKDPNETINVVNALAYKNEIPRLDSLLTKEVATWSHRNQQMFTP